MKANLGIDLGGTKTAVVLGTPDGEVIARALFATGTPAETRRKITEAAQGFGRDFGRIGIACGGPLDTAQGRLLAPPNLPGGEGAELVPWFASDLRRPVAFENS